MSIQFFRSLVDLVKSWTTFGSTELVRLAQEIELRLKPLEAQKASVDETLASLRQVALDRINLVLTPALQAIEEVQEKGFLIAFSNSSITLNNGDIVTFVIPDEAEASLFTPSPYAGAYRTTDPSTHAVLRRISYDQEVGELMCEIVSFEGDPGPFNDWTLFALPGSTVASEETLASILVQREAIDNILIDINSKHADVTEAAAILAAAIDVIANGPVTTVNGKSGVVTLQAHEIPLQGGSSNVQAALDGKATVADITSAINALIAAAPGALNTLDELANALGDDANFAATMTALIAAKADAAATTAALATKANQATTYTKTEVDNLIAPPPIGSIVIYKGIASPTLGTKWKLCNRAALLKASYAALFAILGYKFFQRWHPTNAPTTIPCASTVPRSYGIMNGRLYANLGGAVSPGLYEIASDLLSSNLRLAGVNWGYTTSSGGFGGYFQGAYLASLGMYLVAQHSTTSHFQWSNDGTTFSSTNVGTIGSNIPKNLCAGGGTFACTESATVYRKANPSLAGAWSTSIPLAATNIYRMIFDDTTGLFIAGLADGYIYTSPDAATWTQRLATGQSGDDFYQIMRIGAYLFACSAGTTGDLYRSTNGTTWTICPRPTLPVSGDVANFGPMFTDGVHLFVTSTGNPGDLFVSEDFGATWYFWHRDFIPWALNGASNSYLFDPATGRLFIAHTTDVTLPRVLVPIYDPATQFQLPGSDVFDVGRETVERDEEFTQMIRVI